MFLLSLINHQNSRVIDKSLLQLANKDTERNITCSVLKILFCLDVLWRHCTRQPVTNKKFQIVNFYSIFILYEWNKQDPKCNVPFPSCLQFFYDVRVIIFTPHFQQESKCNRITQNVCSFNDKAVVLLFWQHTMYFLGKIPRAFQTLVTSRCSITAVTMLLSWIYLSAVKFYATLSVIWKIFCESTPAVLNVCTTCPPLRGLGESILSFCGVFTTFCFSYWE